MSTCSVTISVVITSYNYRQFIDAAIVSAMHQEPAPLEILIIDDGSTDGTPNHILENYKNFAIVKLIKKPNGGQYSALSCGIKSAQGEIVAFLDPDDTWRQGYLKKITEVYSLNDHVAFTFSNLEMTGKRHGLWHKRTDDLYVLNSLLLELLVCENFLHWSGSPTSALSIRRKDGLPLCYLPIEYQSKRWITNGDEVFVLGSSAFNLSKYYIGGAYVNYNFHGSNVSLQTAPKGIEKLMLWFYRQRMISFFKQVNSNKDPLYAQDYFMIYLRVVKATGIGLFWRVYKLLPKTFRVYLIDAIER